MKKILFLNILFMTVLQFEISLSAAGTLTPVNKNYKPIQIVNQTVNVIINNGFAKTEVIQIFNNPNNRDLEAIYSFPVPKSASMSEVSITIGEKTIHGEVLGKQKAKKIYEKEKNKGNESGLTKKNGYRDFTFHISPVKAKKQATVRFVYYQPLEIDSGVGRYVYPLEDGGTDSAADNFWSHNNKIEQSISINVALKSSCPLSSVRAPHYEAINIDERFDHGYFKADYEIKNIKLLRDFVFYYKFKYNDPGDIEIIPYKRDSGKPGTFMMVITPGSDLRPITRGSDYIFVLDVSGSMSSKIYTLIDGVNKFISKMNSNDRFRIIIFENKAGELTSGWVQATTHNISFWIEKLKELRTGGGTNLYDALALCLKTVRDEDRATSVILLTDAVTNTGVVSPKAFYTLMKQYDLRIFGLVMGNNANWPLMRTICNSSGGFYAGVSNNDDLIGHILKIKKKVTHECLYDASVKINGVNTHSLTNKMIGKVYHGQQLVFFGKYNKAGTATITLKARLTGKDKVYKRTVYFPAADTDNPEVERLWALKQIEMTEDLMNAGILSEEEGKMKIRKLGLKYQLVTDETSMLVLSDNTFSNYGIERSNKYRIINEQYAQSNRKINNYSVPTRKKSSRRYSYAPSYGGSGGGGAIDPIGGFIALLLGFSIFFGFMRKSKG